MVRGPILGRRVIIRSVAGISYFGIVRAIREDRGLGEVFELGSGYDEAYQRFVHVVDRDAQIDPADDGGEAGETR